MWGRVLASLGWGIALGGPSLWKDALLFRSQQHHVMIYDNHGNHDQRPSTHYNSLRYTQCDNRHSITSFTNTIGPAINLCRAQVRILPANLSIRHSQLTRPQPDITGTYTVSIMSSPQLPLTPTGKSGSAPSTPNTGTWKHPRFDEISKRQSKTTFTDRNIKQMLYNIGGLASLWVLEQFVKKKLVEFKWTLR